MEVQYHVLPQRPDLDHLKNEAKALLKSLRERDSSTKLTDAQRLLARRYGFPTWASLRAYVLETRAGQDPTPEFLKAIQEQDMPRASRILQRHERNLSASLHAMAAVGQFVNVRILLELNPALVDAKAGDPPATALLYACFTPVYEEGGESHDAMAKTVKALLDAGADPNAKDGRYGIAALYGVTGMHNSPPVARLLLEAGADPTDGESVFHAAEHFHVEALELLWEFGVKLNHVGEWGNTAPYFLLRWHDLDQEPKVAQGLAWLLDHGADPNVASGKEQETCLQVAARRGQSPAVIRALLDHGADVHAVRGDGATAWRLAKRNGHDALATLLEAAGAKPEPFSPSDELLAACGRGDVAAAGRLSSPALVSSLARADRAMLGEAAAAGRVRTVEACIAAGFDVNEVNDRAATPLHEAAINGYHEIVKALVAAGAGLDVRDPEHNATPLGWAEFGRDFVKNRDGDYNATVRILTDAMLPRVESPPPE